jgi:peroxiredoxin
MVASFYLVGCVLAIGQPPAVGGAATVETRLNRSQELVYRGTFSETALGTRVQCDRAYRVETRIFVLDAQPKSFDAAIMTILKPRDQHPAQPTGTDTGISSVRLERVQIDPQGKLTPVVGVSLSIPLDGLPLLESGAFVEVPKGRLGVEQTWQVGEDNRPPRIWRVVGTEMANGVSCLKLIGTQQSDDWEHPRGDSRAWRRTDTVWLAPRIGYAQKVERVIERLEPGSREPSSKSVLKYELESALTYPGNHADDRRQEITQTLTFRDTAAPFLANPARSKEALEILGTRVNFALDNQTATPYREALLVVKRGIEAAKKGEMPLPTPETENVPRTAAEIGQVAPDFLAVDLASTKTAQLRKWTGRPVLLVFYHPASTISTELLTFAERLAATYPQGVTVVALSMSDDTELVRKQRTDLKLTVPTLNGVGLRISYNVEATPKVVLLDDQEVVRGMWTGWGPQTPHEVLAELKQWLPKK